MSFRFLIQPAVAIFFAFRARLKDARQDEPPVLGYLLRRGRWWEIWRRTRGYSLQLSGTVSF